MAWYEIINAKSDSYIADRDAEDLLRQFATALQTEDGPAEAEVFYGLTSHGARRYEPMVLVFCRLDNHISILQTKFSDREGHEARRSRLEAMPLDEHIEGGHGEGQTRLKIGPAPMHHLLQMTDERQHREHRLHQHAVLPLAALTQFEIARIALRRMEAGVAQDNHPPINLLHQPLKGVVRDIGGGTRPPHDQPPLIQ